MSLYDIYDLECFMLSSVSKHVPIYIWLSSSSGRGRSVDDQVLDLALMTNYSQSTFTLLVVSIWIDPILSGLVIQHFLRFLVSLDILVVLDCLDVFVSFIVA